jgi:hypothetical protein
MLPDNFGNYGYIFSIAVAGIFLNRKTVALATSKKNLRKILRSYSGRLRQAELSLPGAENLYHGESG